MTDQPEKTALEQSREIVSQLKQMRHDAKETIENLSEIWLEVDQQAKQKKFLPAVESLSGHQNAFYAAVEDLISDYEMECKRMANEDE